MRDPIPPFDPARPDGTNPSQSETLTPDGWLVPGRTYEVPARQGRAFRVAAGQVFVITNTHGNQVGDFWAFAASDLREFLSMEHLRATLKRLTPQPGDALVTNRRRQILLMTEDTSPGVHDTLVAACDVQRYAQLGFEGYHDNCTDNLRMALLAIGLAVPEIPCPLNLWMNTPAGMEGKMSWLAPVSRPGDRVVFQAILDTIVVISCCPMDLLPINGDEGKPESLHVHLQ